MKNRWKKFMMIAGTVSILGMSVYGCGGNAEKTGQQPDAEPGKTTETAGTEKSMGRYLEKEITFPEEMAGMLSSYPAAYMQVLDTGELALAEVSAGFFISSDNGETWKMRDTSWLDELIGEAYIQQIALAPNGAAAVIYSPFSEETEEIPDDEEPEYEPLYLYVDPDGNASELEFPGLDEYLNQFWFGKDSQLYAYGMDYGVYETDTENSGLKKLFETDGLADYVCFTQKYMVVFSSRELAVYDLENGMLSDEDTVLSDFITENLGDLIGNNTDGHSVVAASGDEENVIYFAFSKGLYRHVIGGTAMEQIVDGSISSLGDPSMALQGLAVLPDNEFAVLYNGAKLYRYEYDPDVPTVPDEELNVYSLEENYVIRQAVSLFQKQNPEVYVRYEIGMTGDDGATAEDAVKALNTKLMSGSGPDILVLDGLPAESYKEKGILADVSAVVGSLDGENSLFSNLVDACREDGRLYGLPVRFQLPMKAGRNADVQRAEDLSSLADVIEKLREENPEGELLGLKTEEELLYTLGLSSSAAWTDPDGNVNRDALTEFLDSARRIYQAETAGLDKRDLEVYREESQKNYSSGFAGEGRYYSTASTNTLGIAVGDQKFAVGALYRMDFDFNMITTLADQEEDLTYDYWQGQVSDGFIPNTTVGVAAGSMDEELTEKFFRFLFGRELQDMDLTGGFPMNMASFDTFAENPRDEEYAGGVALTDESGNYFSLDIRWADADAFAWLKEKVQSASRICTGDATVWRTVLEIGPRALNGKASVEDTVDEIVKKVSLYLAE